MGVAFGPGYPLIRAQALGARPVSVPIPNAGTSPRLRYAGRPSLLRKEGKILQLNPLSACGERVVERSKDRVSKLTAKSTNH